MNIDVRQCENLTEEQLVKKKKFEELMAKQENERYEQKQKKIQRNQENKDPEELQLAIQKEFRERYDQIKDKIDQKILKNEEDINLAIKQYADLHFYYVNKTQAMTAYDKQQYKELLDQLETSLYNVRSIVIPRKRFQFSKPFPKKEAVQDIQKEQPNQLQQTILNDATKMNPSNYQPILEFNGGSLIVQDLSNCSVHVKGHLDTLYLYSLNNVELIVDAVKGSVWVDKCIECKFQGYMHQLRIHDTNNTQFIIYVTSKPIIERCTGLKFGEWNIEVQGVNYWKDVQDFNWLKQEKSPNFDLIILQQ